jgi:hypothetical protein
MSRSSQRKLVTLSFKADLLDLMGGEKQFYHMINELGDSIRTDGKLGRFFPGSTLKALAELQKETILLAFVKPCQQMDEQAIENRFLDMYEPFLRIGMHRKHYDKIVNYFAYSLRSLWVDEDVVSDATKYLKAFRHFFLQPESGSEPKKTFKPCVEVEAKEEGKKKKSNSLKMMASFISSKETSAVVKSRSILRSFSGKGIRSSDAVKRITNSNFSAQRI